MSSDYFPLSFSSDGYPLNPASQQQIIAALLETAKPVTDLWILAHGWNNDVNSGQATYHEWITALGEVARRKLSDPDYNPMFVGIHWPSKAWVGDVAEQRAQVTEPSVPRGGGEGEFELAGTEGTADALGLTSAPPTPAFSATNRTAFVMGYRPIIDPEGILGPDYERDFARLYDLIYQVQVPTLAQVEEFVKILKRYRIDDPHSTLLETQNVMSMPVEQLTQRLRAAVSAQAPEHEAFGIFDKLIDFFRVFTFWQMKGRSAIVGERGVYPFIVAVQQAIQQEKRQVRLHLMGHSFGAKLVTAAVYPAASATKLTAPLVDTLVLLLGAFSQFSFSASIPGNPGRSGRYGPILERGVVRNPIVAVYSQNDTANQLFYPFGMRLATPFSDQIYERGDSETLAEAYSVSQNRYGSMGFNGVQGLPDARHHSLDILALDQSYHWDQLASVYCLSVDGTSVIRKGSFPSGAHSDLSALEIYYLAFSMARR